MDAYLRYPDRVRLMAVCDIVRPLAEEYARKTGVEAVYTDYEQMLREADIDAVDICTGHRHHAPQAIAAAEAGKHALTEKAMAQEPRRVPGDDPRRRQGGSHADGRPALCVTPRKPGRRSG